MVQAQIFANSVAIKKGQLLLTQDFKEAQEVADVCRYMGFEPLVLSDFRATFGDDLKSYKEELYTLFSALRSYYEDSNQILIAPFMSMRYTLPTPSQLATMVLEYGQELELTPFKTMLIHWGYNVVDMVQSEGEVSFRGDIIDIFIPSFDEPFRISLFDTLIEEIRTFDIETQRFTSDALEQLLLQSALFSLDEKSYETMMQRIENSQSDVFVKDMDALGFWYLDAKSSAIQQREALSTFSPELLFEVLDEHSVDAATFSIKQLQQNERIKPLVATKIPTLLSVHKAKKCTIIAQNEAQLKQAGLHDMTLFEYVQAPYIVNLISDDELIISLNKRVKKRRKRKTTIILDELKRGDYVVHEEYGVGLFEAIEQATILGGKKDFIVLRYQGEDKVLLPVENLNAIDRYIANAGSLPAIDRLGKGSFAKLKEKVKSRLFEIAQSIVATAAQRELIAAPKLTIDDESLTQFQAEAGFEYTPDQAQSINEIREELASGKIMDRLLSGDVGFGKTEVAMNAIYMAKSSNMQSLLVVPTTLLCAQHFTTLKERFKSHAIVLAKLDRFSSAKEKKSITQGLADGSIDCVVGTHALFSLSCARLGLVIIDEEHKFGVKQKEKLKELYAKTHLLSMSATPIPRSLNQAMSSIKTMSTLMTPPSERQGVRTFVKAYDEALIKEVIMRELRRGGQIFYVFNAIDAMPIKKGELLAILPSLRILMLHSKVSADQTQKELLKFANKEYDILLATSIIESGIHMPTVNTMIVDGADRFGIADLHQLRGRVGRGHIEGYAYFIVEDKELITDEAKKRLVALESNSFLGSGAVLAYHDLEIRGGGNLIGDAQSGHIKNIGYSLYLRMLEDAIKLYTNQSETTKANVDMTLAVSAFLSEHYISEDRLRLDIYRRLSQCERTHDIYEIESECSERFGKADKESANFFTLMVIKVLALEHQVKTVTSYGQNVTLVMQNEQKVSIKAQSKDDEDILEAALQYLRTKK